MGISIYFRNLEHSNSLPVQVAGGVSTISLHYNDNRREVAVIEFVLFNHTLQFTSSPGIKLAQLKHWFRLRHGYCLENLSKLSLSNSNINRKCTDAFNVFL